MGGMIMPTREGKLTVQEAAKSLGVTDGYLRRLLGRGDFPGTKFGDQWSIDVADVEERRAGIGRRSKRAMEAAARPSKARKR